MKTSVKEAMLNRLHYLAHDTDFIRKNAHLEEPQKYVTIKRIMQKGVSMSACFCHSCNTKYTIEASYSMYSSNNEQFKCPVCGNHAIIAQSGKCNTYSNDRKHHRFIHKTDSGFEFVNFYTYDKFIDTDDWYEKDAVIHIGITNAGIFHKEHGYFVAQNASAYSWSSRSYGYKVLRKNSSDEENIIYWLKDYTDTDMTDEECKDLLAVASEHYRHQAELAKEKSKKRKEKKAAAEELERQRRLEEELKRKEAYELEKRSDPRWQYPENDKIDLSNLFSPRFLYKLYSMSVDGQNTYLVGCTKCGKVSEVVGFNEEKPYTCSCGNHLDSPDQYYSYESYRASQVALFFENTDFEENDLLIRVFRSDSILSNDDTVKTEIYEIRRIFAREDGVSVYSRSANNVDFEKDAPSMPAFESGYYFSQSESQVVQIVQNSCLKYSGLIDSWNLGKYKYQWSLQIPSMVYLRAWYDIKGVEAVFKSDMPDIAQHIIASTYTEHCRNEILNPEGKNLAEILKVDPKLLKMARPMNPSYDTLMTMQRMYELDNTLTRETYEEIIRHRLVIKHFMDLMEMYGIRYSKTMQYLNTAYDHQCIDRDECLTVWSDYLRMARALGINLSDKQKRFPTSLKKEHDIAVFAYRAVRVEIDQRAFAEHAEINKKRYEFENDDFVAIIPTSPQEIIEEANAQNNCLRSYVERVRKGETVVVFVRRKSNPDKTYLSAEIFDNKLTQLKGYCNSDPRPDDVVKFVSEWATEKLFIPQCL